MAKRALVVWGGWEGHEPENVARLFETILTAEGFEVRVSDTLDSFADYAELRKQSLIVPIWTMGKIEPRQCDPVLRAVAEDGVGLAGCHGGMCDAFREDTEWQFLTGGQWVAHPGGDGVRYTVRFCREETHPITDGLPDFEVRSEQYYLHVDPAVRVLAYTEFPHPEVPGPHEKNFCRMPQAWTKHWGAGRVFYCALGHRRTVLEEPAPRELMRRGFLWAAKEA